MDFWGVIDQLERLGVADAGALVVAEPLGPVASSRPARAVGAVVMPPMPRPRPPTERQREVLREIRLYIATHGRAPSIRELTALIRCKSTRTTTQHLMLLEKKELVAPRRWHAIRDIQLTATGHAEAA